MAATTKQDLKFLERFEPDVFWLQHGRKVLWVIGALGLIAILAVYQQKQAAQREEQAATRLAQATDAGALQAIAKDYPSKGIGAQALLCLGDLHYEAGRLEEATAVYQDLVARFPSNPLADPARLSLVAIAESKGEFEAAKVQYLQMASRSGSYLAVAAKIGAARCAEALGQTKEAQQFYEDLVPAVRGTAWEGPVLIRRAVLTRSLGPVQAAAPAAGPGFQLTP